MARKRYKPEELLKVCPVCGYDKLEEPPFDAYGYPSHEVCPCCGFEYGFDDSNKGFTYEEYRKLWIDNGFEWFSSERTLKKWNREILEQQLINLPKVSHYEPHFVMDEHKKKLT